MSTLKSKVRDAKAKGKQLRREGIIPAVLYGKHLEESISIQIPIGEVRQFLKSNSVGSTLDLMIGRKKYMALLKEVSFTPGSGRIEHLCFQAMTAGEKVSSIAHIVLVNDERIDGIVQQSLYEIAYRALPADLVEKIEINLEGKQVGDSITVADLDLFSNEAIEVQNAPETVVVSISARKEIAEDEPEEEAAEAPADSEQPATEEEPEA